jgi:hypothetical protein
MQVLRGIDSACSIMLQAPAECVIWCEGLLLCKHTHTGGIWLPAPLVGMWLCNNIACLSRQHVDSSKHVL